MEDAQAPFLRTVTNIEIGTFCNRRCGFCPNGFPDRISTPALMDDALLHGIAAPARPHGRYRNDPLRPL